MAYPSPLDSLADPTRRAVLESLRGGARSVGDIASGLPVSRPAVSQHLRVLKDAGLVRDTKAGAKRLYELDLDGIARLRSYVEGFWDEALARYGQVVENEREE